MYMTKRLLLDPDPPAEGGGGESGQSNQEAQTQDPPSWRNWVPEEFKTEPCLSKIPDDPKELIKSYVNAQKLIGVQRVPKPDPSWDDKKWGEFYNQIGRPEAPDKYNLPDVKDSLDDKQVDWFRSSAHKWGLTDRQFKGLMADRVAFDKGRLTEMEGEQAKAKSEAEKALRQEWGDDSYETNLAAARAALEHFASPELIQMLEARGLGNDPTMAKAFHAIGRQMMEDQSRGKGPGLPSLSREQTAQMQIKELREDPVFSKAYNDPMDPAHAASKAKIAALYKVAYPGQKT